MALAPTFISLCLFSFTILVLLGHIGNVTAQSPTNISLSSSLTARDDNLSWESPSGKFAFGFRKMEKNGFLLAIWFNKIAEITIVWSANGNNLVKEGSKVELNRSGLFLNDPKGNQIWNASVARTGVAYYAALTDTGNFVVANNNSVSLWESFNEPTDTLLPTQTLTQGRKLVARYSETNYSSGKFHFVLQTDGNLVLYTRQFPLETNNNPYWASNTVGSGFRLMFNQSGFVYLEAKNGTMLGMLSSSINNSASTKELFYQRTVLEYDGVFRHYVYLKNNRQNSSESSTLIPPNICTTLMDRDGPGVCGFNSYCSIEDDQRPKCNCPYGYTWIDPNDERKGCKRNFDPQSCDKDSQEASGDLFYYYSLENTDWPQTEYEYFNPVDEEWCKMACLGDCFCAVAFFRRGQCFKRKLPLVNGRSHPTNGGKAHIKIRRSNSSTTSNYRGSRTELKKKHNSKLLLIGSVFLSGSVFLNILLLLAGCYVLFQFKQKAKVVRPKFEAMKGMNLRSFTYEELEKATNGFSEQLGSGAFGTVFKGVILPAQGRNNLVAIKKLDSMDVVTECEQEFKAEVSAIGRTNHKNLVQLIGYCNEGQHRLLVYEFMSNGSLANFLFGPTRPNWYHRMQIALGTAMGLFYLHEECSTQIIHCDIKPQNILLDDCFTARISDFGLAKILKAEQTRTNTGIRGTKGYVAPEWFRNMAVTVKIDVYSYGILLLELIFCRRNFEAGAEEENQMILADWVYDCYKDSKLDTLVVNDDEALADMNRVEKYVMVALWCIQENPSMRPTMKKVTQMLEGTIQVSIPPDPSSFISSM